MCPVLGDNSCPYPYHVCRAADHTAFQDTDKGGNITVEEFARVMRKTNPSISDEEVSKIISEVDLDGDGTINFDGE